jgi:hypothetical protein
VFDVCMTDPLPGTEPVPLTPPEHPVQGDSHAHLLAPLTALAHELGYRAEIRELPEAGPSGWCDPEHRQIVVATGPANCQVRTLVHELAHALGLGYQQYGREQAEVLVDCATYIVCCSAGLDVGGESIPYIAGWGEDGALDAIREYAETIDTITRRIEDALEPTSADQPATGEAATPWPPDARCSVGGVLLAPMFGQPRPTERPRPARAHAAGRACPRRGACSLRPNPTVRRYSTATRRTSFAVTTASSDARRSQRSARDARTDRGRLPERLGHPPLQPAPARHLLRMAPRGRHPRGLPSLRYRTTRPAPRRPSSQ